MPTPPPSALGENEEDVPPPLEDGENVEVPDEVELENEGEQPIQEPPPQPPLRRSERERQPSRKYPPDEFVMITEQGSPRLLKKPWSMKRKASGRRLCKKK